MKKRAQKRPWQHSEQAHASEEGWAISYADLITLIMAFFAILYSMSTQDDKKFSQITEGLAEAFKNTDQKKFEDKTDGVSADMRKIRALHMLISSLNLGDSIDEAVKNIEKNYAQKKNDDGIKEFVTHRLGKDSDQSKSDFIREIKSEGHHNPENIIDLILPDTSLFPSGSHLLTQSAEQKLRQLAAEFKLLDGLASIEVVGHTDSVKPSVGSSYRNNFNLSFLRAGSVANVLVQGGIENRMISVRGMEALEPLFPEYDENHKAIPENQAKNRRVHIILKKKHAEKLQSH